jgi:hypothetical protein
MDENMDDRNMDACPPTGGMDDLIFQLTWFIVHLNRPKSTPGFSPPLTPPRACFGLRGQIIRVEGKFLSLAFSSPDSHPGLLSFAPKGAHLQLLKTPPPVGGGREGADSWTMDACPPTGGMDDLTFHLTYSIVHVFVHCLEELLPENLE